jgi:hypothetical protein
VNEVREKEKRGLGKNNPVTYRWGKREKNRENKKKFM